MQGYEYWRGGRPRHIGKPVPRSVRRCWFFAALIFVNLFLPWNGIIADWRQQKPMLLEHHLSDLAMFIEDILEGAKKRGNIYSPEDFETDYAKLSATRNLLDRYTFARSDYKDMAFGRIDEAMRLIRSRACQNLENQFLAAHYEDGKQGMRNYVNGRMAQVAMERREQDRSFQPSFFPPPSQSHIQYSKALTLRGFARAWFWSLIPALCGVLLQIRAAGWKAKEELLLRPWWPVLTTVFWWWCLGNYNQEQSAVEIRFERLKRRFRREAGHDPNEREAAELLQRAAGPILSLDAAIKRIKDMPELVQVRSRRAIFAAWVVAMLSGPIQFLSSVGTAVAQSTVAAKPVPATVDSTRRRPSGSAWGFFQSRTTREGFDLPLARLKGAQALDGVKVTGEVDAARMRLLELAATISLRQGVSATIGQVFTPTTYDYPAPFSTLIPASPLDPLNPNFHDRGAYVTARKSGTTAQIGLLNGEGPNAPNEDRSIDVLLRLEQKAGALNAAVAWQDEHGGPKEYKAAFVGLSPPFGALWFGRAERTDLGRDATHLRLEVPVGKFRGGVQLEHPRGLTVSIERWLGGKNRLAFHWFASRTDHPRWEFRLQREFAFVN